MADIHIKISDVERIRSEVARAQASIAQALKAVDGALRSADWSDGNRRQFEESWKAAQSSVHFDAAAIELTRFLNQVITNAKNMGA